MPSILPGYEYDIYISYRQKDNEYDGWVTEFVENLTSEIKATFKEDISIYFDENPHDGLLETHDVDQSLNEKVKCLVFIPIVSQTYCDPNCFAWQKEFLAFRDFAKKDDFGLDINLANRNVAKRILPVRIHEIDETDQSLFNNEIGGVIRAIDFIYKSAGVNRPLRDKEDHPLANQNKTIYRDQINKVANAVKEIIVGIKGKQSGESQIEKEIATIDNGSLSSDSWYKSNKKTLVVIAGIALVLLFTYSFFQYQTTDKEFDVQLSVAVLPFSNTKPDPETNYLGFAIANQIIGDLVYLKNITVRPSGSIRKYENQVIDPITVSDDLKVDYVLIGFCI